MIISDKNNKFQIFIGIIKNGEPFVNYEDESHKNINQDYFNNIENELINEIYIPFDFLTPSEIEGISEKEEKQIRFFCNTIIQESGIVLKLPQMTILTAMNIFNRFYWKRSFIQFEPFHVICASLSLSTKVEETFRRLRDIISSCYFILKRKEEIESQNSLKKKIYKDFIYDFDKCIIEITSEIYNQIKTHSVIIESYILKELGFSLYNLTDHPHKYLLNFIKNLKGTRELLQRSWNYLNDIFRTSLVVNFKSNTLACAAIFLAARIYYFTLPNLAWWEAYEADIEDIQEIVAKMMRMDENNCELRIVRKILKRFNIYKEEIEYEEKIIKDKKDEEDKINREKKNRKEKYKYGRSRSRSRNKKYKKHRKRSYSSSSYSSSSKSDSYRKSSYSNRNKKKHI